MTPTCLGTLVFPVEAGKVLELRRALGAAVPQDLTDLAAGDAAGVTCPPTVSVVAAHWGTIDQHPTKLICDAAGFDMQRIVLGGMEWRWSRWPAVGDLVRATVRFDRSWERTGASGRLRFAAGVTQYADHRTDEAMFEVETTVIEVERLDYAG